MTSCISKMLNTTFLTFYRYNLKIKNVYVFSIIKEKTVCC